MDNTLIVEALDQLKPFLNDNKLLEIVMRDGNKRIKAFQKVALNDLPQSEAKELAQHALLSLNKGTPCLQKNLDTFQKIANLQNLNLVLNGLNLCASCAGFAILYKKLDSISNQLTQQVHQLQNTIKTRHDIQTSFEFNKVLADYTDMLDSRRKQHPYSEEKMRELVDREYNTLDLLIRVFQKGVSADHQALILSIFSLLSMFTVSLRYFDELYYFNNHHILSKQDVWHSAHSKWMGIYDTLSSRWFVEALQDYGTFETELDTVGVDVYCSELLNQVADLRQEVEDNQELIVAIGDISLLNTLRQATIQQVKDSITDAFSKAFVGHDTPQTAEIYDEICRQVAAM